MTYTIAHIVDGFGHSANVSGCNMNEYRHMTYRIHFCPWNNFTDGTPYHILDELHGLKQKPRIKNISQLICMTESWLTPHINKHQTEKQGYGQFYNRLPNHSKQSVIGGILFYMYVNKS